MYNYYCWYVLVCGVVMYVYWVDGVYYLVVEVEGLDLVGFNDL